MKFSLSLIILLLVSNIGYAQQIPHDLLSKTANESNDLFAILDNLDNSYGNDNQTTNFLNPKDYASDIGICDFSELDPGRSGTRT